MPSFKTFLLLTTLFCQFSSASAQMPPAPPPPPIPPELLLQENTVVAEPVREISAEKRALIQEYLRLSGRSLKTGPDMQDMMSMIQKQMPILGSEFTPVHPALATKKEKDRANEIKESTALMTKRTGELLAPNGEISNVLEEAAIQAYDRHFSEDDLRQIIAFYNTPIGQKLCQEQAAIEKELIKSSFDNTSAPVFKMFHEMMKEKGLFTPRKPVPSK